MKCKIFVLLVLVSLFVDCNKKTSDNRPQSNNIEARINDVPSYGTGSHSDLLDNNEYSNNKKDSINAPKSKKGIKNIAQKTVINKKTVADRKIRYTIFILLFILIVVIITPVFFFLCRKKKIKKELIDSSKIGDSNISHINNTKDNEEECNKSDNPPAPIENNDDSNGTKNISDQTIKPIAPPEQIEPQNNEQGWVIVGASVKGNGHIQSDMPCQDNNKFELYENGWGIAVVSDGAGSAKHSDLGSKVVVERCITHFKKLLEKESWIKNNILPTDAEWLQKSYYTLKTVRDEIEMVSNKNYIELKSLSATCLVVIFSPLGLLTVHVGDGRMGYQSVSGEWKAIMTPHKGSEANQTIFLISEFWTTPNYVMSGVLVPESVVIRERVKAFTLMSDGCENTAWQCTAQNPETGKYYDRNKPFEGFFNPLEETMLSFQTDNIPFDERQTKWYNFIESGTNGFIKEQDDKSMILAVYNTL